jgi:acyl-CoA dehydrogenase
LSDDELLRMVLRERPAPLVASDLPDFWRAAAAVRARFAAPIDRAIAGGAVADRMGYAFASGYQAALVALVPGLSPDGTASFCVTEDGGNRPRNILSRLESAPSGAGRVLTGSKRWSTMAPLATTLVVIANAGARDDGRPVLAGVRLPVTAKGLTLTEMPAPPFVPEVTHAELAFDGVVVADSDVLPGDAYDEYVKPFRTVEDLHVQAALLGYLTAVAFRHGFPESVRERLVALIVAARGIARLDARRAETHLALAGLLAQIGSVVADADSSWPTVGDSERERWYRDVVLVNVAQRARTERRARAFESILGDPAP